MKIQITIKRTDVLHVVEGLSGTIAQHNGGEPSFEKLWASPSDRAKLDIWWRDGIMDLEESLMKWLTTSSTAFELKQEAGDLQVDMEISDRWSEKLTGLLKNRIQYYLVHVVMAGWLSDFADVKAPDYKEIAKTDLYGIMNVLLYRELVLEGEERHQDADQKEGSDSGTGAGDRHQDAESKEGGEGGTGAGERHQDAESKEGGEGGTGAGDRHQDAESKEGGEGGTGAGERHQDTADRGETREEETVSRDKDDAKGCCCEMGNRSCGVSRDKDDYRRLNHHQGCWTDWSGGGLLEPDWPHGFREEGRRCGCGR